MKKELTNEEIIELLNELLQVFSAFPTDIEEFLSPKGVKLYRRFNATKRF